MNAMFDKRFSELSADDIEVIEEAASVDDFRKAMAEIWFHELNEAGRRKVHLHLWAKQHRQFHAARRADEAAQGAEAPAPTHAGRVDPIFAGLLDSIAGYPRIAK